MATQVVFSSHRMEIINQIQLKFITKKKLFQEFLETLKAADVLPSDWEVVFPDVPIDANEQSEGVFSVAG